MTVKTKKKLLFFGILAFFYILINFLPFYRWIPNELYFLTFRICTLFFFATCAVTLKKINKIEIEKPIRQISYFWLIPLLIPCFTNFFYVYLIDINPLEEIETNLLIMDLFSDFFLSIFEDIVFVDILNSFFLDIYEGKTRNARIFSMLSCATIFTIAHSYNFLINTPEIAAYELVFIFLITMECSYLSIYFDKEIIPIGFHILFNSIDFVAFHALYSVQMSWKYFTFSMILAILSLFYILALVKISSLQKYRKLHHEE